MCTVIFVPQQENGFILGSIRDENPKRIKALEPQLYSQRNMNFLAPMVGNESGTWLGVNQNGASVILLNGGFASHFPRKEKYRISRGLIVKQLLLSPDIHKELSSIGLDEIEPFTLIIFDRLSLTKFVWDGQAKHSKSLSTQIAHIWSSSTLYSSEVQKNREELFQAFRSKNQLANEDDLKRFFFSHSEEVNGFIMNRSDEVKSLSISFLHYNKESVDLSYFDISTSNQFNKTIQIG
jgi:uncharacterized protein with NRDE domain